MLAFAVTWSLCVFLCLTIGLSEGALGSAKPLGKELRSISPGISVQPQETSLPMMRGLRQAAGGQLQQGENSLRKRNIIGSTGALPLTWIMFRKKPLACTSSVERQSYIDLLEGRGRNTIRVGYQ